MRGCTVTALRNCRVVWKVADSFGNFPEDVKERCGGGWVVDDVRGGGCAGRGCMEGNNRPKFVVIVTVKL